MSTPPIHDTEIFSTLADMVSNGRRGVLATVITAHGSTPRQAGSKMVVHDDGSITGTIGGGAAEGLVMAEAALVLAEGLCRRTQIKLEGKQGACGGAMEVFLEPVLRDTPFTVIGAGHVGRALLELGRHLPFRFTLVDDRPAFLEPWQDRPGVKTVLCSPADLADKLDIKFGGAVLLASRGHELDRKYLTALLQMEGDQGRTLDYIGAVGSMTKAKRIRKDLLKEHPEFSRRLESVRMPVGLDLGDETPPEIALSIFSEALAVLRKAPFLKGETGLDLGLGLRSQRNFLKDKS